MNRSLLLSLCLISLILLLPSFNTDVQALGPNIFVSPDGTGDTCSQALPCLPNVGIQMAVSGDRVYFRYGNYTGDTNPIFTIEKNISLYGGWDGVDTEPFFLDPETYVTTIDGQKARSLLLIDNDDSSYLTIINGFTFTRGFTNYDGGAIEVNKGMVFIEGNRFLDNDARWNGGAIHIVSESDVVILNNVFNDNTAGMGGSIFVKVPGFEKPTFTI